mmetsp:Transcript_91/g.258  ORF Transcript_91/g.258 Transcript_91/m.258 type:complete len:249 (-) Transcript_91:423-1169(-)
MASCASNIAPQPRPDIWLSISGLSWLTSHTFIFLSSDALTTSPGTCAEIEQAVAAFLCAWTLQTEAFGFLASKAVIVPDSSVAMMPMPVMTELGVHTALSTLADSLNDPLLLWLLTSVNSTFLLKEADSKRCSSVGCHATCCTLALWFSSVEVHLLLFRSHNFMVLSAAPLAITGGFCGWLEIVMTASLCPRSVMEGSIDSNRFKSQSSMMPSRTSDIPTAAKLPGVSEIPLYEQVSTQMGIPGTWTS